MEVSTARTAISPRLDLLVRNIHVLECTLAIYYSFGINTFPPSWDGSDGVVFIHKEGPGETIHPARQKLLSLIYPVRQL